MNFTNVCNAIKTASLPSFGLKTVAHDWQLNRDAAHIDNQFQDKLQEWNSLAIIDGVGNIAASASFVAYLISLYTVLKKTGATKASAEFDGFWDHTFSVLLSKEKEYAVTGDRFYNFKKQLKIMQRLEGDSKSVQQIIMGNASKHIASCSDLILQYVPTLKSPRSSEVSKQIHYMLDEKFGDLVNYVLLATGYLLENE